MSLYAEAAGLIQSLIQGSDQKFRAKIDAVLADLHVAHRAAQQAVAEGAGRLVTIAGSAEAGFIVAIHNGTHFRNFVLQAGDEVEALGLGLERFGKEVPEDAEVEQPVAPPAPRTDVPPPDLVVRRVERPFDGDPNALDVTRGRVGDEDPDPEKRPNARAQDVAEASVAAEGAPVPPGVAEAAPEPGMHDGNEQAVSYEAHPEPDAPAEVETTVVESSEEQAPVAVPVATEEEQRAADPISYPGVEAEPMPIVPAAPAMTPGEQIEAAEERAAHHEEVVSHASGEEEGSKPEGS